MLLMLGKCDRNARRAANMHATKYPDGRATRVQKCFITLKRVQEYMIETKINFDINVD